VPGRVGVDILKSEKVNMGRDAAAIDAKARLLIIASALTALFLGAMDSLIMTAAMPTIVAELGGFQLYSWVYSAYFLARAVSLPLFGKLADLYSYRRVFLVCIGLFLLSSIAAGFATHMIFLIGCRFFQGIGAGGNFALVYIVLADIALPGQRAKTMSFAGSIWGVASLLGPTLGGFIVNYTSWRWLFFLNVPLGLFSLAGIAFFLVEIREKKKEVSLDIHGAWTLSFAITGLLVIFLLGGRDYPWISWQILTLALLTCMAAATFLRVEKRVPEPILTLAFFRNPGFSLGNGAAFLCSFSIFSMFAFVPIFLQGALAKTPVQVGIIMLSLSLGWSLGSLVLGQISHRLGIKNAAIMGAVFLLVGCALTLSFSTETTLPVIFLVFQLVGLGMGFVSLSTLLIVQNTIDITNLGVATSSHQFARTLGGAVGVGICGGLLTSRLTQGIQLLQKTGVLDAMPGRLLEGSESLAENLLRPEFQSLLTEQARAGIQQTITAGVDVVFWITLVVSVLALLCCVLLPRYGKSES
jgi:EmrB/QacA subfamily drug resistance transporter